MLVSDGSARGLALAPWQADSTANYVVVAEIQEQYSGGCGGNFGIVVRKTDSGYYAAGNDHYCGSSANIWATDSSTADEAPYVDRTIAENGRFDPGTAYHTYRLEVKDNAIRLLVDGGEVVKTVDNKFLTGGQVGLFASGTQLSVRSFKVIAP